MCLHEAGSRPARTTCARAPGRSGATRRTGPARCTGAAVAARAAGGRGRAAGRWAVAAAAAAIGTRASLVHGVADAVVLALLAIGLIRAVRARAGLLRLARSGVVLVVDAAVADLRRAAGNDVQTVGAGAVLERILAAIFAHTVVVAAPRACSGRVAVRASTGRRLPRAAGPVGAAEVAVVRLEAAARDVRARAGLLVVVVAGRTACVGQHHGQCREQSVTHRAKRR